MTADPYRYFRAEARDLLDQMSQGVMELEKKPAELDGVPSLLRAAHTLKGAARVVRQPGIAESAHGLEELLAPFREGAVAVPRDRIVAAFALLDAIEVRLAALSAPSPVAESEARTAPAAAEPFLPTVRAEVAEVDELVEGISGASAEVQLLMKGIDGVEKSRRLAETLHDLLAPGADPLARPAGGELSRLRAVAEELCAALESASRAASTSAAEIERGLTRAREAAQALRLVGASVLFTPLERMARDAAAQLGLTVTFETSGGQVQLDAHVVGAVQRSLVQLVRNAVAHGIEPEAARRLAGKPPEGLVRVEVSRRGREIAVTCRDDGRGVDLEAVRKAARRKGIAQSAVESLDGAELLRLLFRGGITTSASVTESSGRGIGLDVVRECAERLGGRVDVSTERGKGTAIALVLPLSVASVDALLVTAGGETVALPLDGIRKTVWIGTGGIVPSPRGEHVVLEGVEIPFSPLGSVLGLREDLSSARRSSPAVIVASRGRLFAVGVDRLLGTRPVILRPAPAMTPPSPLLAGLFRDSEGVPRVVLDPEALADAVRARTGKPLPGAAPAPVVLVVDDSLTTRMLEQSILESAGYEVDVAASAEEAFEKTRERRYALFLVDVEMPGMNGYEFVARAAADPALKDVPAILVTSRSSSEDRRRGREAGARDFIVKSEFDQATLLSRIEELVR